MSKGGKRPGAGRPPAAERKLSVLVRLSPKVAQDLREIIPARSRSAWIQELIVQALSERSACQIL